MTVANILDPVADWTLHKQRVLVPFDFSEASRRALHVARSFVPDLGQPDGGSISVIHVITPPPITAPGRLLRGPFDEERAIAHGFSALREALSDAGMPELEPHVRVASNPAEEIVGFAERELTELIIISSHARTGFDRWLIGSTAERVVRLAPCPVLVLRGPRPQ
ncbi:MAG TPA: universal stress protein [Enhygromyxa sp.]|nr:universal stress protein [Enhygromyxa sp.]